MVGIRPIFRHFSHILLALTALGSIQCRHLSEGEAGQLCEPGEMQTCLCGGGQPDGTQACATDGASWGVCDCETSSSDTDSDADSDGDTDADTDGDTDKIGRAHV